MHLSQLAADSTTGPHASHASRRLSDRIEEAFDQACAQGQAEVAACMLKGLDLVLLGRPQPWNRRHAALGVLHACQARLEQLRSLQNESAQTEIIDAVAAIP